MCTDASSGIIISQVKPAVLLKTPTNICTIFTWNIFKVGRIHYNKKEYTENAHLDSLGSSISKKV